MDQVLEFLKEFNFQIILSVSIIVWYFTNQIKKSLHEKIYKLDLDIREMETRVGRLEGAVFGKDVYKNVK